MVMNTKSCYHLWYFSNCPAAQQVLKISSWRWLLETSAPCMLISVLMCVVYDLWSMVCSSSTIDRVIRRAYDYRVFVELVPHGAVPLRYGTLGSSYEGIRKKRKI
jgi:hypothetical protein